MKKLFAILLALGGVGMSQLAQAETYPNTTVEVVLAGLENAHEATPPAFLNYYKDEGIQPRGALFAPPVVPHSVTGMQVSKNTNRCLECHSPDMADFTGATPPSKTHFYSRSDELSQEVSPRRYFCLQCHVPQTDAKPITEQTYVPPKGFDPKAASQPLPQVTKTPEFEALWKADQEKYKHSSDPYLNQHH